MPKNPVRAARQAARQAVRSAKTSSRMDTRALKTAAKVEKIGAKAAGKVAKIQAAAPKRAASEPMTKMESKGATKIAQKTTGPAKSTPRSMSEVAKGMKPAKTEKKSSGSRSESRSGSGGGGGRPAPAKTTPVSETIRKSAEKMGWDLNKKSTPTGKGIYDGMSKDAMDYSANDIIRGGKNTVKETGRQIQMYGEGKVRQAGDAVEGAKTALKRGLDLLNPFSSKKKGGSVKKYQAGGMTGGSKLAGTGNLAKAKAKSAVKLNSPSTINKMQKPAARKVATPGRINPMTGGMKKGGSVKRKK